MVLFFYISQHRIIFMCSREEELNRSKYLYVILLCHNDPMKLALFSFNRRKNSLREVKEVNFGMARAKWDSNPNMHSFKNQFHPSFLNFQYLFLFLYQSLKNKMVPAGLQFSASLPPFPRGKHLHVSAAAFYIYLHASIQHAHAD